MYSNQRFFRDKYFIKQKQQIQFYKKLIIFEYQFKP